MVSKEKNIVGACIGDCVHIAGIYRFLQLAEQLGHKTHFLGPAVNISSLVNEIEKRNPDVVAVSYRLTPEKGKEVIEELKKEVFNKKLDDKEYLLGGLPALIDEEKNNSFFKAYFQGEEIEKAIKYLKDENETTLGKNNYPQNIIERINSKKPLPVLRHHFGLPSLEETYNGIIEIANSETIDVISLATDQNAQAHFFHPERMSKSNGAGGVPIRTKKDLESMFTASRRGNYPLLRTYAGTDDLIKLAELYLETINNAWTAIPLSFFNEMDGRGPMDLKTSFKVHLDSIKWHAKNNVPVEILEAHHWSLRDAPDEVAVASAYLAANICKSLGVKNHIAQYMFNTPAQTSFRDDLAKMLAKKELIESIAGDSFKTYVQTRTGLFSHPVDMDKAKGQLAASTMLQMQLNPDIIHVLSYSEANHAATPENVIESAKIVSHVAAKCIEGQPSMHYDPYVVSRKNELKEKALGIYEKIKSIGEITNPDVLVQVIKQKILRAPQLESFYKKIDAENNNHNREKNVGERKIYETKKYE